MAEGIQFRVLEVGPGTINKFADNVGADLKSVPGTFGGAFVAVTAAYAEELIAGKRDAHGLVVPDLFEVDSAVVCSMGKDDDDPLHASIIGNSAPFETAETELLEVVERLGGLVGREISVSVAQY